MSGPQRGAEAYRQAYEYVAAGNPALSRRKLRRLAKRYLNVTASPPLTKSEKRSARKARKLV